MREVLSRDILIALMRPETDHQNPDPREKTAFQAERSMANEVEKGYNLWCVIHTFHPAGDRGDRGMPSGTTAAKQQRRQAPALRTRLEGLPRQASQLQAFEV